MQEHLTFIDTHAHIYLTEFDDSREVMMQAAADEGIGTVLMPAIDAATHNQLFALEAAYPSCKAMMGVHPCSVSAQFKTELALVERYLAQRPFIAVGEIGLDFYWSTDYKMQQYEAFQQQLELALKYNLPVSIHSRNATDECLQVVAQYPGLRGVFHCFSGSVEQAFRIMDRGLFLGIGGVVTFKNGGLDKVIPEVGLGAVVLETDSPYLAPVPYRGKRNQPAYIKLVAEKLATLLQSSLAEVAVITTGNAEKLFALDVNP